MHGGYGGYTSLPGYDITDFKHTENHFVYGAASKETICSSSSILRLMYSHKIFSTLILGSPYTEKLYTNLQKANLPKKKKITFSFLGIYDNNSYYFGYDRPYEYLNFWDECRQIVGALSMYSDKYEITIKDYPSSPFKFLVEELLQELKCDEINYISSEISYKDVINKSNILIYPWVSTSFIEGLNVEADILLFDNSNMCQTAKKTLQNCTIFSTEIAQFLNNLKDYLKHNENYKSTNIAALRDYYMCSLDNDARVNKVIGFFNE